MNILSQTGDTPLLVAAKDRREAVLLALVRVEAEQRQAITTSTTTSNPANRTVGDRSRGRLEGSLFNSYYTEV